MGKKGIETMVGVFVLLGLVGLVFLALKAANLGSFSAGSTYSLVARFDNIGGLKRQAPVRTAGVTVGRVVAIELDKKSYQGLVHMEVDSRIEFPKDSSARILTAGLLGDQYIGVEPGAADKMWVAGDSIKQTQSAVVLESLISQFLFSKAADGANSNAAGTAPKK